MIKKDSKKLVSIEAKIKKLTKKAYEIEYALQDLIDTWAIERCPHSIGDVVPNQNKHMGNVGKMVKITGIAGIYQHPNIYYWEVRGHVLRKDGTPMKGCSNGYTNVWWGEGDELELKKEVI